MHIGHSSYSCCGQRYNYLYLYSYLYSLCIKLHLISIGTDVSKRHFTIFSYK